MWTVEQRHQYNAAYYRTHRASEIQRVRSRQRATLEFLRDLRRRPCSDCGQTFPPWVMDFDHRDPCDKSFPHTTGRALLKSRAALMLEIAKCDVVCANCHAFRTYRQMQARKNGLPPEMWAPGKSDYIEKKRERWRLNAQLLRDLCDVPCADCGIRFPSFVMQFDHRDPTRKRFTVSRIITRSREVIVEEVAKCDVVCANCHRIRTYSTRLKSRAGVA